MVFEIGTDLLIFFGTIIFFFIDVFITIAKTPHVPNPSIKKKEILLLPLPKHRDPTTQEYLNHFMPKG